MESPPSLEYAKAKTRWAKKHLNTLKPLIDAYSENPYSISKHDNPDGLSHIIRFDLIPMKESLPLLLGCYCYALRSGLDQLAWQLALLTTNDPGRKTCFPVHDRRDAKSEATFREIVWDIPCAAVEQIRLLQPYNLGDSFREHPLWKLHHLCNMDKHRTFALSAIDYNIEVLPPNSHTIRHFDDSDGGKVGFDLIFPISLKEEADFKVHRSEVVLGETIDAPGFKFEMRYEEIEAIYDFIREEVLQRFVSFFPQTTNP